MRFILALGALAVAVAVAAADPNAAVDGTVDVAKRDALADPTMYNKSRNTWNKGNNRTKHSTRSPKPSYQNSGRRGKSMRTAGKSNKRHKIRKYH